MVVVPIIDEGRCKAVETLEEKILTSESLRLLTIKMPSHTEIIRSCSVVFLFCHVR